MKTPKKFEMLVYNGLVDEVVSQLMSGKEAEVYVVRSRGELCCAKVYKNADNRSFSKQAQYQEGRKGKSSRQALHREEHEVWPAGIGGAWQNTEADTLRRLAAAGEGASPFNFLDGVC
jgi:RIO kinase 1